MLAHPWTSAYISDIEAEDVSRHNWSALATIFLVVNTIFMAFVMMVRTVLVFVWARLFDRNIVIYETFHFLTFENGSR
jgi:hypothetical protein